MTQFKTDELMSCISEFGAIVGEYYLRSFTIYSVSRATVPSSNIEVATCVREVSRGRFLKIVQALSHWDIQICAEGN